MIKILKSFRIYSDLNTYTLYAQTVDGKYYKSTLIDNKLTYTEINIQEYAANLSIITLRDNNLN